MLQSRKIFLNGFKDIFRKFTFKRSKLFQAGLQSNRDEFKFTISEFRVQHLPGIVKFQKSNICIGQLESAHNNSDYFRRDAKSVVDLYFEQNEKINTEVKKNKFYFCVVLYNSAHFYFHFNSIPKKTHGSLILYNLKFSSFFVRIQTSLLFLKKEQNCFYILHQVFSISHVR